MHRPPAPAPLSLLLAALAWAQAGAALGATAAAPLAPPQLRSPDAAQLWPRLFYTPQQRLDIEAARRQPPVGTEAPSGSPATPDAPSRYTLEGLAQGRKGATAWINGHMLQQGEPFEGRTVHIANGMVYLRQEGASDIVLRPGQTVGEGAAPQDLVPARSIVKK